MSSLDNAYRLAGIPGLLIHGRLDLGAPADVSWQLAHAWPHANLQLVGMGHLVAQMTNQIMNANQDPRLRVAT